MDMTVLCIAMWKTTTQGETKIAPNRQWWGKGRKDERHKEWYVMQGKVIMIMSMWKYCIEEWVIRPKYVCKAQNPWGI